MPVETQTSKDTIVELSDDSAPERIVHSYRPGMLKRLQRRYREYLAEFLGTFVLIIFGNGVVAQVVLHDNKNGEYLSINLAWGLGVLFGIYASGGISGAHLNPAVTLAFAVHKGFSWKKVPGFVIAQVIGAFAAAAVIYGNYRSALDAFDGGVRHTTGDKATAGIFATYPQPYLTTVGAFFSEFIGTAILMIGLFAIGEANNSTAPSSHSPIAVALLVMAIGMSLGAPTGYAINPARDVGPRLLTLVAGWGTDPFTVFNHYFWIPIAGPIVGGVMGGYIFRTFSDYSVLDKSPK